MPQSNIELIVEWVWVPIVTWLVVMWRKFTGVDTRTQLLERAEIHYQHQRREDHARFDRDRTEMLEKVGSHHDTVMTKLDSLELRIKNNGHG